MMAFLHRIRLSAPALALLCLGVFGPLLLMAFVSTRGRDEYGGLMWSATSLDSYFQIFVDRDFLTDQLTFNVDYIKIIARSLGIAAATTAMTLLIGFPAALWAAFQPRKIRTVLILSLAVPFFTNQLVRTYAWILLLRNGGVIETSLKDIGLFSGDLNLLYTPYATTIGLAYSFLPYMILPIYVSIEKIDRRLIEAAYDLGANRWRILQRVIIPLAVPGIVSGCLLVFIPCIGSFVSPELLGGAKSMMVGNLIQGQFGELRNWPLGAALSMLVLFVVFLGFILRRNIVNFGRTA